MNLKDEQLKLDTILLKEKEINNQKSIIKSQIVNSYIKI